MGVFNLTLRPSHSQEGTPVPINRRLGGPQIQSGRFGEEKIIYPYRESNPGPFSP
jgi:hypothetical protein